jgi:hypothetical protein
MVNTRKKKFYFKFKRVLVNFTYFKQINYFKNINLDNFFYHILNDVIIHK